MKRNRWIDIGSSRKRNTLKRYLYLNQREDECVDDQDTSPWNLDPIPCFGYTSLEKNLRLI